MNPPSPKRRRASTTGHESLEGGKIFLAHAGVALLPERAAKAVRDWTVSAVAEAQETPDTWARMKAARVSCGKLINRDASEVALLGPTALGLNLVANGLPWKEGDEIVYHADDYPANVYPWIKLRERGVRTVPLCTAGPGRITWSEVEAALTPRTRLVALASCHYLSGWRIDELEIGSRLRERGILFCVDAIQTLGSAPFDASFVDFLSADSHKWMLGPVGAGLFFVRRELHEVLRPTLLGAWNVCSPEFVAQDRIVFEPGARRYEPGTLNAPGILGMAASVDLLLETGLADTAAHIAGLVGQLACGLERLGFKRYGDVPSDARNRSGILSVSHPGVSSETIFQALEKAGITVSLRAERSGRKLLRISPHLGNTSGEVERVLEEVRCALPGYAW